MRKLRHEDADDGVPTHLGTSCCLATSYCTSIQNTKCRIRTSCRLRNDRLPLLMFMFAWTREPHAALLVTVSAGLTACTSVCMHRLAISARAHAQSSSTSPSTIGIVGIVYNAPLPPRGSVVLDGAQAARNKTSPPGPDVGLRAQIHAAASQTPSLRAYSVRTEPNHPFARGSSQQMLQPSRLMCCGQ
ncbi:hypothetical protein F4680DRAFT_197275 [Xylaria scruposa]|nr:hypothetical protein F4680DRAFT_197275 [Xylaria scruposa]